MGVRRFALLAVLTLAVSATACTGAGSGKASGPASSGSSSRTTGPTRTVSPPPKFSGTRHALPSGSALANDPMLYKTVGLTGCEAAAHGWQGAGTVHNQTSSAIHYRIVVLFTDAQARTVDSATTTLTVPPATTRTWTAKREFVAPRGTRCVVRAVHRAR